jgi:hypothetical protein
MSNEENPIEIKQDGTVLANGKEIGKYDKASNTLHAPTRFSPSYYAPLKAKLGQDLQYDFAPPNEPEPVKQADVKPEPEPEESEDATSDPEPDSHPTGILPAIIVEDPEPARDPMQGDKTPEWARWLKRNRPEEFQARFAGRILNLSEE